MRTLYHTPLSPSCRKIRILLREKELDFELVQENYWERRTEFFALNPAGEVPVLLEPDGETICGNYALMEYLEESYRDTNKRFMGGSIAERAEVRRIIDWFDDKFNREVTLNILFEKVFKRLLRYGEPQSDALRAGKKNILYHLEYIAFLTQEHRFLGGDTLTLADMAAAAHLSALDYLGDVPWDHNAKAKEWYALMKSRPSLRTVLADRVGAFHPPEHYENPDF
jgi:glutathione S-transferase